MVSVCIFLITKDVKHLFICLFAISVSSLVKFLFMSFVHFLIRFLKKILTLSYESSLCVLDTRSFFCWICDSPFLFLVFSSSLQSLFFFSEQKV